MGKLKEWIKF